MRKVFKRSDVAVEQGEKVLAEAPAQVGGESVTVAGTTLAFYVQGREVRRWPWETITRAEWDAEESMLTVVPIGEWGTTVVPLHCQMSEHARLLELVRERITASVVIQRTVEIGRSSGVVLAARRAPGSDDEITWTFDYGTGVDPADPDVRAQVGVALDQLRSELGFD